MKRSYFQPFNYSRSLLSVFDIGGTLFLSAKMHARGLDSDIERLSRDQNALKEDYKKACERLEKDFDHERNGTKE